MSRRQDEQAETEALIRRDLSPTGVRALSKLLDMKSGLTVKQLAGWTMATAMFVGTAVRMEVAVTGTYNRLEAAEREIALMHKDIRAIARAEHVALPSEQPGVYGEASAPLLAPVSALDRAAPMSTLGHVSAKEP